MLKSISVLLLLFSFSLAKVTAPEKLFFYTKLESVAATDEMGRQGSATAFRFPSVAKGFNGNGIRFQGIVAATDALSFGPMLISGDVTYSVWLLVEAAPYNGNSRDTIFSNQGSLMNQFDPSFNKGNSLYLYDYAGTHYIGYSYGRESDAIIYQIPFNAWTHVAIVGNATSATFYINGVEKPAFSVHGGGSAILNPITPFSIGANLNYTNNGLDMNTGFRGIIDEFRIYNAALTAAQIRAIYEETFEESSVPLVPPTDTPATTNPTSASSLKTTTSSLNQPTNSVTANSVIVILLSFLIVVVM